MKKYVAFLLSFTISILFCTLLKAEQCAQCERELSDWEETVQLDETEILLRRMYCDFINRYISEMHYDFINRSDDKELNLPRFYDHYHVPARDGLFKLSNITAMSIEVEEELASKVLPKSAGSELEYDKLGEDIKNTISGLKLSCHGFEIGNVEPSAKDGVCYQCLEGILPFEHSRPTTPLNMQLAIRFNKIVEDSGIVIVLYEDSVLFSANYFLLDYFKIFSGKRVVVGLEAFDEDGDFTRPEFESVKQVIEERFNDYDGDQNNSNNYSIEVGIITSYCLPLLRFSKYAAYGQLCDRSILDLLKFIELRCRNTHCFGVQTPLAVMKSLDKYKFDRAVQAYYGLIKQVYEEFNETPPSPEQIMHSHKDEFVSKLAAEYKSTNVCREEMAQKICRYYKVINPGRGKESGIPFIISLRDDYGVIRSSNDIIKEKPDPKEKESLIQVLVKKYLEESGFYDVRVTTVYVAANMTPCIYSQKKNALLEELCLDYVLFFWNFDSL